MVLGLLASALVYRFSNKTMFTESLLFGLYVWLSVLGLNIASNMFGITFSEFIKVPAMYFLASMFVLQFRRFKTGNNVKLALIITGIVLAAKAIILFAALTALGALVSIGTVI